MSRRSRPELSLVIPIYNEEEVLPTLDARLKELITTVGVDTEVVFIDDGSKDSSLELLRGLAAAEPRYRVVAFARNFGHQRAITAGMDAARGKAIVVMDADLQDPPEVVRDMLAKHREGYDVVFGKRRTREGETWFKLFSAKLFYRLFRAMIPIEVPLDTGDFRLMSRRVVLTMRGLRETHRFVRGLVAWVGFKQTAVEYDRAARAAGETKYPLKKMIAFAIDGIASFSVLPLRAATYLGVLVGTASVLYGIAAVITHLVGATVPGWTTTVVLVSFLFSVQFLMMGVLGEYVGRIYEQVKGRPLYIVAERINFKRRTKSAEVPQAATTTDVDAPVAPVAPIAPPPIPPIPEAPAIFAPPVKTSSSVPPPPSSVRGEYTEVSVSQVLLSDPSEVLGPAPAFPPVPPKSVAKPPPPLPSAKPASKPPAPPKSGGMKATPPVEPKVAPKPPMPSAPPAGSDKLASLAKKAVTQIGIGALPDPKKAAPPPADPPPSDPKKDAKDPPPSDPKKEPKDS